MSVQEPAKLARWSRHVRRSPVLLVLAVLAALVLAGAVLAALRTVEPLADTAKPKPNPRTVPRAALKGTAIIRLGSSFHAASGYQRFSYIVVDAGDALAAGIRKFPGTTLVYMNGTSLPDSYFTGVSHDQAAAHGWLLRDADGQPIMNVTYGHEEAISETRPTSVSSSPMSALF